MSLSIRKKKFVLLSTPGGVGRQSRFRTISQNKMADGTLGKRRNKTINKGEISEASTRVGRKWGTGEC